MTHLLLFRPVGMVCNGGRILVLAMAFLIHGGGGQ